MRFKIDKNLELIAKEIIGPADLSFVAENLCQRFINAGLIEDTPDNYGENTMVALGDCMVADVCKVLAKYLYDDETHSVPADVFDALCKTVLMGEYDCPKCGGKLIYDGTKGHELQDGDYYTPNSYVIDFYLYHCPICGETIKSKNEL